MSKSKYYPANSDKYPKRAERRVFSARKYKQNPILRQITNHFQSYMESVYGDEIKSS